MKIKSAKIQPPVLLGLSTLLLGMTVLFGWHSGLTSLVQIHGSWAPMKYNTALLFVFSGFALAVKPIPSSKPWLLASGVFVSAMSAAVILEYLIQINFGIDEFFMKDYLRVQTSHAGRMALNAAVCFFLISIVMILRAGPENRQRPFLSGILSAIVLAFSVVVVFAYLSGAERIYGWGDFTKMAFQTAAGILILSSGLLLESHAALRRLQQDDRLWLSGVTFLTITAITLCLWQALAAEQAAAGISDSQLPWIGLLIGIVSAVLASTNIYLMRTAEMKNRALEKTNRQLKEALAEIKTLKGFIPICSWCKKIRNDKGAWDPLEAYIQKHSEAVFSHGICPNCYGRHLSPENKAGS
jgi:hypothetical protein